MTQDELKRAAAEAALACVEPGSVIGVGTGSTTNHFIDLVAARRCLVRDAVASSEASARRLTERGIEVVSLTCYDRLALYVDGADEATRARMLIKGGGAALTREKIVAEASERFVCIVDDSKLVARLGRFPLPVEVLPMACRLVAGVLERLGGRPVLRRGVTTDNGNLILDAHELPLADPREVEATLDRVPGAVANGLFCRRPADLLLVAREGGGETV